MRYVSLFSGIEAASVAWEGLGWEPVAFAEIEKFPCEVLAKRFPSVPNLGDVSEIDWRAFQDEYGAVDLVVGGSPCQAFSVAGRREGLLDERGQLMLEYVRAVRELHPRWVLWENVPGVLSQSDGDAFETLQRELEHCGYSLAWRTLDAQFFGVAQRRRRVFLVGHASAGCAAAVLFEPDSLRWDSPSSREKRKSLASSAKGGTGGSYTMLVRCGKEGGGKEALIQDEVSATLSTSNMQTLFQSRNDASACYAIAGNIINRDDKNGGHQFGVVDADENGAFTLNTIDRHAVAYESSDCLTPWDAQSKRVFAPEHCAPTLSSGAKESGTIIPSVLYDATDPSLSTFCFNATQITSKQNGNNPQWGDPCHCLASTDHPPACVICMADDNAKSAIDRDMCGSLKVGGGVAHDRVLASNGEDFVGTLCARDFKGVGSEYVGEGKVITTWKSR